MDSLERTYRYADSHLNKADRLLGDAEKLRQELREHAEEANSNYRSAIMRGEIYVPVDFMRADNEFDGVRMKIEDKQNEILINLNYSLCFCAELLEYILHNKNEETFRYRRKIRLLVEHLWEITQYSGMKRAPLDSLIPSLSRMECLIVLKEDPDFVKLREVLREIRFRLS